MQRHQSVSQGQSGFHISGKAGILKRRAKLRHYICGHRNAPAPALRVKAQSGGVFARKLDEISTARQPLSSNARQIAGRVFHADDVFERRQFRHGFDLHINHAAPRNIVNNQRQVLDRIIQRGEMRDEPGLRRLVIIGRNNERGCRACFFGMACEIKRFLRRVRAGSGNDGHATSRRANANFHHAQMLIMAQCRRLARRAARHQPVRASVDLALDQRVQRFFVNPPIAKRCYQRGNGSTQHWCGPHVCAAKNGLAPLQLSGNIPHRDAAASNAT